MKKIFFIAIISLFAIKLWAQVGPDLYYIEFTDKAGTPYTIDNPQEFLSQRAIERRNAQNIAIDSLDLPVSPTYIAGLEALGLEIVNPTKWFNGTTVRTSNYDLILQARELPYVKNTPRFEIDTVETAKSYKNISEKKLNVQPTRNLDYGYTEGQIAIHNGDVLHNEGFKGEGMLIAITDAGFVNVSNMSTLQYLVNSGRIIATRDFAYGSGDVYGFHEHGSCVLSVLAGYIPGTFIGTAPEAEYVLITSENVYYEAIVEELNWVTAVEYADSIGADVVNVSLGYVDFDSERYNHAYTDMDGHTTPGSIGASIAASRGMLIVSAAGNSGGDESGHTWLGSPSDADSVICVGAIDVNENYAYFSSLGLMDENRIKPDVTSVGRYAVVQFSNDIIDYSNGTSFATPIMAGLTTCFWQKFREKSAMEIYNAILNSARPTRPTETEDPTNYTTTPNIFTGRGIPDFVAASEIFENNVQNSEIGTDIEIFPNPATNSINISVYDAQDFDVEIISVDGKSLKEINHISNNNSINISDLDAGYYIIRINSGNIVTTRSFVKE